MILMTSGNIAEEVVAYFKTLFQYLSEGTEEIKHDSLYAGGRTRHRPEYESGGLLLAVHS
jgi:hypothetical protein